MKFSKFSKFVAAISACSVLCAGLTLPDVNSLNKNSNSILLSADAASENIENQMEIGTLGIAGGGFVSGIITGKTTMYARTDVGGAYKYNYDTGNWDQLLGFIDDNDRGLLSIDAMCIDPNDENNIYMLAGCAYFSSEKTVIFRSRDGGKTFDEIDVTKMIQVHGNGDGRQFGESIAVDPDNSDIIYCGGDVTAGDSALIMSKDGGDTWEPVKGYDKLGLFKETVKWPTWTENIARCVNNGEYNTQNGVSTVMVTGGKVYVGTTVKGENNLVMADVGSDDFTEVSADLPTEYMPTRINLDADGNLLITYASGACFDKGPGAAYKYNPTTGEVIDITPKDAKGNAVSAGYGGVFSDPKDSKKLVATTCAQWYSQLWQEWTDEHSPAWGDRFFRSTDGGKTWTEITPGNNGDIWGGPLLSEYLNDGGRPWIRDKAIHWTGAIVLDPRDNNRFFVTSGNGVFACDNTWDKCPQIYFEADGIEEVVALDMVSVPGGNPYSAIGDYDGFEHTSLTESIQHQPNIGSTSTIAYCPSNPKVMVRVAQNDSQAYYTTDGGAEWKQLTGATGGVKAAINQLEDGSYRIYISGKGSISYSDDFGATWNKSSGVTGSRQILPLVDAENPKYVYAYTAQYNDYWFYDTTKSEPTFEDAHYTFMVSDDYGATFTSQDICKYDQCDEACRISYLGEGELVVGAGWYGAYHVTDYGKKVEKLDSVFYCKTIGYGAPEKEGAPNALYMYGQPEESDPQGIYRSSDGGKTWVAININHLYGGTGNGNFLVGDMNEFGTVYMSTVGCGIVYMKDTGEVKPITTTTTTTKKEETTTTTNNTTTTENIGTTTTNINEDITYGDINGDGKINLTDVIYLNKYIAGSYMPSDQGLLNANCDQTNKDINLDDTLALLKYLIKVVELPIK